MTPLLALGICALVVFVLLSPFRTKRAHRPTSKPRRAASSRKAAAAGPRDASRAAVPGRGTALSTALLDEKDRLFQALADLRFDFEAGKLSQSDFEEEDSRLRARAADVLRELER